MEGDVFCKIISGEIATEPVYRDEQVMVVNDIHPQAPVHLLVIPVKHVEGIADLGDDSEGILSHMLRVAHQSAEKVGLDQGYRLIINEGEHGGKVVPHLHLHVLGGKKLGPKIIQD
jgi:histidine triad (HIT) family protein